MATIGMDVINTQLWKNIGAIAENETLMRRLCKYVSKLAKEKEDEARMTEKEFYEKIERAEAAYERGEYLEMLPGEDLTSFLKRVGDGL